MAKHSPFSQDALLSSECFILDDGANGHIYVWKGWNLEPNLEPEPSLRSKGTFHVRPSVHLSVCVCVCPPGKDASSEERRAVLKSSEKFLQQMAYPAHTQVAAAPPPLRWSCVIHLWFPPQIQVLPEHSETPLFKQFFSDWRDPEDTVGMGTAYVSSQIAKVEKVNQSKRG